MKTILAFGNPLLDVTVSQAQENISLDLLKKYNLKVDGQKEINKDEMSSLSKDIQCLKQHISPGGCCQNSLRVLQWVTKKKFKVFMFGSVGKDKESNILRNILEKEGVQTRYIEQDLPTGKTIALVNGLYRSLIAYIGAAGQFGLNDLLSCENFEAIFNSSHLIFIEAFFLQNRFETAKYVVDRCRNSDKMVIFNLCGEYIFQTISESIKYLVTYSHIVFGNKTEFMALKKLMNYMTIEEMASELVKVEKPSKYDKILVITDGPNVVKCYTKDKLFELEPIPINKAEIKDATGAGDAFAGGFLAGLCMSKNIKDCLKIGFYSAKNIISQSGCSLPLFQSEIVLE